MNAAILVALNVSANGWDEVEELVEKFLEGEIILIRLKDEDITASCIPQPLIAVADL